MPPVDKWPELAWPGPCVRETRDAGAPAPARAPAQLRPPRARVRELASRLVPSSSSSSFGNFALDFSPRPSPCCGFLPGPQVPQTWLGGGVTGRRALASGLDAWTAHPREKLLGLLISVFHGHGGNMMPTSEDCGQVPSGPTG